MLDWIWRQYAYSPGCRALCVFCLLGDPEFGTGFDANGSSESFELVTEENNGDGSKKQGTEGTSEQLTKGEN